MAFNIISPFALSALPEGVATSDAFLDDIAVEVFDNVDAAGGSLAFEAETSTWTYTDIAGAVTTSVITLPEGYTIADGVPTVFGADLSSFVVPVQTLVGEEGAEVPSYALVQVGLDDAGAPTVVGFSDGIDLRESTDGDSAFYTYPMGDGTVGYAMGSFESDTGVDFGVLSATDDGISNTVVSGGVAGALGGHVLATSGGGVLGLVQTAGDDGGSLAVIQYDAEGAVLAGDVFDASSFPDFEVDAPLSATFLVDENGELAIFATADVEGAAVFGTVLDLLPATDEPVIEPPLPPVDEEEEEEPVDEEPELAVATPGDEDVRLTSGDDVFDALGGNDTIKGLGGKDWIVGGDGDDSIDGGAGDDALIAGEPVDGEVAGDALPSTGGLYGGAGADNINGRMGSDWIDGGDGNDDLRGGLGSDSTYTTDGGELREAGIFGGEGDDFIRGNRGNDDMFGGAGNDDMNGGFGDDIVYGGAGDDKVSGFNGSDELYGGDGADNMNGGRGDDVMFGGAGDDVLRGSEGNDQLWATGGGEDLLIGGKGADAFGVSGDTGTATVKDFTVGEDVIASDAGIAFEDIVMTQDGKDAVIEIGETILVLGKVNIEDLSEDDFLFIDPTAVEEETPELPVAEEGEEPIVDAFPGLFLDPRESAAVIEEAAADAAADGADEDDLLFG